jgi:hypothetical protein
VSTAVVVALAVAGLGAVLLAALLFVARGNSDADNDDDDLIVTGVQYSDKRVDWVVHTMPWHRALRSRIRRRFSAPTEADAG